MLCTLRASKPGNLLSVAICKSFGMRPQREFRGKKQTQWALQAIASETAPAVALIDHTGAIVAKSASYAQAAK